MRLLHSGHDYSRLSAAAGEPKPERGRNPPWHRRQPVSMHRLSDHRQGDPRRRGAHDRRQGGRGMTTEIETAQARTQKLEGLGTRRKRVEDVRFTQGKGNYIDDFKLPGMLFGDFVRSPYGHARVKSIDKDAALKLPGVKAVLTADDLKPLKLHWMPTLAGDVQAVLADEKVLFQGQELALVVAEDRYVAADAGGANSDGPGRGIICGSDCGGDARRAAGAAAGGDGVGEKL